MDHDLESTPHFLSKVQQLYDMMDLSDGLMLLGKQTMYHNTVCLEKPSSANQVIFS